MELLPIPKFQQILKGELESIGLEHKKIKETSDRLAYWCCIHLLKLTPEQAAEACRPQGSGERGIDIFHISESGEKVIVGQAETGKTLDLRRKFGRGIVSKLNRALNFLTEENTRIEEGERIFEFAEKYSDAVARKFKVEFWAIVGGTPDDGLQRELKAFNNGVLKSHPRHSADIKDVGELLLAYSDEISKRPYPTIELDIVERMAHGKQSFVTTVSASSVADAVKNEGLRVFEQNARLPILSSDVNTEIKETLTKAKERGNFWSYNNGLTILCTEIRKARGKRRLRLVEAQIVNGCQTAWTLSETKKEYPRALDDVEVLCRITKTEDPHLSSVIRRATNRQTAVSERDLMSGDLVQKRLQLEFQRLGYFYQRKRDEWNNLCLVIPQSRMYNRYEQGPLDNQKLAQLHLAFWNEMPAQAKGEKAKIFKVEKSRFFAG